MKYFFTTIFLCFTLTSAYAQPCVQGLVSTFQKIAGGASSSEESHCVITTSDGGYLIVGQTDISGTYDFFLHKVTNNGGTQWFKTYGNNGVQNGESIKVIEASDGSFLVSGREDNASFNAVLFKVDNQGNFLWKRKILSGGNDQFLDVIETSTGDYICVGTTNSFGSSSSCLVVKFSLNGTILLNRVFSRPGVQHAKEIIEKSNGNFVIFGTNPTVSGGLMFEITPSFNVVWAKSYTSNNLIHFGNAIQKANGNFVIVGFTDISVTGGSRENILVEIDSLGVPVWSRIYGTGVNERGADIALTVDNEIIFTSGGYNNSTSDLLCIKTDSVGGFIWGKLYGGSNYEYIDYYSGNLTLTQDTGGVLVGRTKSFGAGSGDSYMVKFNRCGESYCNEQDVIPVQATFSINTSNVSFTNATGGTIDTSQYTQASPSIIETFLCQDTIPQCQILVDFNADTVCIGDSTHFIDLSFDPGYNIVNWQWVFGDGNSAAGIQNPSHIYSSPGMYQATLIVTNDSAAGCVDSITKTVVVNNLPTVDAGLDQSLCDSGLVVLGGSPTGPLGSNYLWLPNNGTLDDDTIPNPTATVNTSTTFYVTVVDTNGCSNTDSISVVILSSPLLQITDDTTLCENDTILLNATNNTNYTYNWYPAYNLSNTSIYNPILVADSSLTYYLIVTDTTTGCSSIDSIVVNIHLLNMFSDVSDNFEICEGDEILVSIPSEYTVLWQDSSTLNNYVINQIGTYHVIAYHQCRIVSDTFLVDMKDCNCEYYIPNVITNNGDNVNDVFNVSMSSEESCTVVSMQIFNRWGQTIFESTATNPTWNGRTNAGDAVPEGTYFYIIEIEVSVDGAKETEVKKGYLTLFR